MSGHKTRSLALIVQKPCKDAGSLAVAITAVPNGM